MELPPLQSVQANPGRLRPLIAWVIILLCVSGAAVSAAIQKQRAGKAAGASLQQEISARYIMGLKSLNLSGKKESITSAVDAAVKSALDAASTDGQKVRVAILAGEIKGPISATDILLTIKPRSESPLVEDIDILMRLYTAVPAQPLSPEESQRIAEHHGWLGKLAAIYARPGSDPARAEMVGQSKMTVIGLIIGVGLLMGAAVLGLAGLITAIVLLVMRKITVAYRAAPRDAGAVAFLEAFALYLVCMIGLGIAGRFVGMNLLAETLILPALPLVVILYLRGRGVSWGVIRARAGLFTGRHFFFEILCGIGGYISMLPVIAVGAVVTILLSKLSGMDASHPIDEIAQNATAGQWVLLWILACVLAPVIEEFMFRGVFYSWMRGRWGWLISSGTVSLIFAALHPQAWAAIPALAAIGWVLNAIRQWRGGLVASMTAHALHNGLTMAVTMLLLG